MQSLSQFFVRQVSIEGGGEAESDFFDLFCGLVHKLQSVMLDADPEPCLQVPAGLLRLGAKNGVPAPNVRNNRVRTAFSVPQSHPMLFAWTAAVFVARAA